MALVPLDALCERARYTLRHEGWRALVKQGISFVLGRFFSYGHYYIYEKEVGSGDSWVDTKPGVECTVRVVSSLDDLEGLAAQGHDVRAMNFRPKLRKGAIAFCLFAGDELASVTWVARTRDAKPEIDPLPFFVYFEAGEVCTGASYTHPAHRGRGLVALTYHHIVPYLADAGVTRARFSIGLSNIRSQGAHAKLSPRIASRGRYLKVLCWDSWREQPVRRVD